MPLQPPLVQVLSFIMIILLLLLQIKLKLRQMLSQVMSVLQGKVYGEIRLAVQTKQLFFDVKKAKVKPNATLTMAADSATTLELEFDLYVVTISNEKIYMNITEIE